MLIERTDCRIAKQYAAATVGLQTMLMRINYQGIHVFQGFKRRPGFSVQLCCQPKIAAIGGIGMQAKTVVIAQASNSGRGSTDPVAVVPMVATTVPTWPASRIVRSAVRSILAD